MEDEFRELYAARAAQLRRTAFLLCGDWQRAEDATQDALVKLYVSWARLVRKGSPRAKEFRLLADALKSAA